MSARINLVLKPILPVIDLKKNDGSSYTWNHFTGTRNFALQELIIKPPYLNEAGSFEMRLHDPNSVVLDNIRSGNLCNFHIGKANDALTNIMLGAVKERGFETISESEGYVQISGTDFGNMIFPEREVAGSWGQRKDAGGNPDPTDPDSPTIKSIAIDMLTKRTCYPAQDLTPEDQGLIVDAASFESNFDTKVPQYSSNIEKLADKMRELCTLAGNAIYGAYPNKHFFMKVPQLSPTEIVFTDDEYDAELAALADHSQIGLISHRKPTKWRQSSEGYVKQLFGLGTGKPELESSQETTSTPELVDEALALRIDTVTQVTADSIALFISKIGAPTHDLEVGMYEDNGLAGTNSKPTGSTVEEWSKGAEFISTSGSWVFFPLRGHVLNSLKKYWIVVYSDSASGTDNFRWHRDAGTSYTRSTSADQGLTWTTVENSYGFAYQYRYSRELISMLHNDYNSIGDDIYYPETVVRVPDITDSTRMDDHLDQVSQNVFYEKQIYECAVLAPDTLLNNGDVVRCKVTKSPGKIFDYADWVISNLQFHWQANDREATGNYHFEVVMTRLDR